MKKNLLNNLLLAVLISTVTACGGKDKKETADAPATSTSSTPDAPAKTGMSVADATAFLDGDEANSGKEVTVSAYSWGSNERMDEKIQLNLGDKKLEGMQSASFSCMFPKDQAAAIKAIAKDAMVTVTGKISRGAGGVELNECKLVQ